MLGIYFQLLYINSSPDSEFLLHAKPIKFNGNLGLGHLSLF